MIKKLPLEKKIRPLCVMFEFCWREIPFPSLLIIGLTIRVEGSGLCHVETRVYNCMAQLEPNPFINHVK